MFDTDPARRGRCVCRRFPILHCDRPASQEDLLCDTCRGGENCNSAWSSVETPHRYYHFSVIGISIGSITVDDVHRH